MNTLKNQVKQELIKCGNSINDVEEMIYLHFEYASNTYSSVKRIAECIRIIY